MLKLIFNLDINEIIRLYNNELWAIFDITNGFNVDHSFIRLRLKNANVEIKNHKEN